MSLLQTQALLTNTVNFINEKTEWVDRLNQLYSMDFIKGDNCDFALNVEAQLNVNRVSYVVKMITKLKIKMLKKLFLQLVRDIEGNLKEFFTADTPNVLFTYMSSLKVVPIW